MARIFLHILARLSQIFSIYGTLLGIAVMHAYQLAVAWKGDWNARSKYHTGHWTLASSRSVFVETADTVMRAQNLALAVTAVVIVVCCAPILVIISKDVMLKTARAKSHWEFIGPTCGPGVSLCSVAW
jgi:hypothetical protein